MSVGSRARRMKRRAIFEMAKMNTEQRDSLVRLADTTDTFTQMADRHSVKLLNHFLNVQAEIEDTAYRAAAAIVMWVLHDKWGWNRVRLARLTNQVVNLAADMKATNTKFQELMEQLAEETDTNVSSLIGKTPLIFGGAPVITEDMANEEKKSAAQMAQV